MGRRRVPGGQVGGALVQDHRQRARRPPSPDGLDQTRSGGYVDALGTRYVLHKRARGVLSGPAQFGGLVIGNNKLVPRR